jgi:hypothetical protein
MKICKFDASENCRHTSCSLFDFSSGNVSCCPLHRNPFGFFAGRRAVRSSLSLIQVWALRKKDGVVFGR